MAFVSPILLARPHADGTALASAAPRRARVARAAHRRTPRMTASDEPPEDPLRVRVRAELAASGIDIEDLLDAGKAIALTRKLDDLEAELESLPDGEEERREELSAKAAALRSDLSAVKRQVMRPFLKRVFVAQAMLSLAAGGLLAADALPTGHVPLVAQALGFWSTWLFSIPSLRARKGMAKWEKNALNAAFVATPLINVALPTFTKNCGLIWLADTVLLGACYAFYLVRAVDDEVDEKEVGKVRGIVKYLDWGSWK